MSALARSAAGILRSVAARPSWNSAIPHWGNLSMSAAEGQLLFSCCNIFCFPPCYTPPHINSFSRIRLPLQLEQRVQGRIRQIHMPGAISGGSRPLSGFAANSKMTPELFSEAAARRPDMYCDAGSVSLFHAQTKLQIKRNVEANCAIERARDVALFMLMKILPKFPGKINIALQETWKRHMEPVARKYADRGCMDPLVKHEQLEMLRNPFRCFAALNEGDSQLNFQATAAQLVALDKAYEEHWDDLMEELWDQDEAIDELYIRYIEPAAAPWDGRGARGTEAADALVEQIAEWVERDWFDTPPCP